MKLSISVIAMLCAFVVLALMLARTGAPPSWAVATWRVQEIRGRPAIYRATLSISADGAYSGFTGCSNEGGKVSFRGNSLRLAGAMFDRGCASWLRNDQMARYLRARSDMRSAQVDASGSLIFLSETGEALVRFIRLGDAPPPRDKSQDKPPTFAWISGDLRETSTPVWNGDRWRIEKIRGQEIIDDSLTTLRITPEGDASGSTGCNSFHGTATISEDKLRFGHITSTVGPCSPALADQERRFLGALAEARGIRFDGFGAEMHVISEKGEPLLTLGRLTD